MENNEIIIEVKTTWIETEGQFVRNIIEYRYDKSIKIDKPVYSTLYIKESNIKEEYASSIEKNTFEFNILENKEYKKIDDLSDIEKTLLRFTKNKWELY